MLLHLEDLSDPFKNRLAALRADQVLRRIRDRDHTVWNPDPDEIANRLGWLDVHDRLRQEAPDLVAFARDAAADGFTHAVLLGMGGSSLAPEVFRKTFGVARGMLDLKILDSTDPDAIRSVIEPLDPAQTLFIVSSKSGGTVETFSLFKYAYNRVLDAVGEERAGNRFIAITDPGSGLAETGERYGFRAVFLNDPEIGGRYSALSLFGLVPAALVGVDLDRLLESAAGASAAARSDDCDAARLGVAMGVLAAAGRDKLTLVCSPEIESFGDWVEQLVAESTGKRGLGILPVVGERRGGRYGDDRFFVGIAMRGDDETARFLDTLERDGHPVARFDLADRYNLGGQYFTWELATAIAGHVMGIQPFDQPNVESAKVLAREMMAQYEKTGELPAGESAVFAAGSVREFLSGVGPGDYIAVHAYMPSAEAADAALADLRWALREGTGAAVTIGYGPRFLHSTGQLHKGDGGNGLFIQLTSRAAADLPIPDEAGSTESSMSFGTLKLAQALGDFEALRQADPPRKVIRFHLEGKPSDKIAEIAKKLSA